MIQVIIWLLGFALVACLLNAPLWLWARKRAQFDRLDLAVPFIAVYAWLFFSELGVGSTQSLSNLIEVPITVLLALAASGLKVTGAFGPQPRSTVFAQVFAVTAIFMLRLLMPLLPE